MGTENFKIIEVTDFKKKVSLNISQNSQEHFCAVAFSIELHREIPEMFKNNFLEHLWAAAFRN